jgi:cytosine/adenosine deaminase-related metal-dependent hydrolase
MTYRKFQADHLFTGQEMKDGNSVLVTTDGGVVQTIIPAAEAGEGIERLDGMLCPGFVNCHCHLELSHLKGRVPEKTGLVDFLLAVIKERAASSGPQAPGSGSRVAGGGSGETGSYAERVSAAIAEAEGSMLDNGIVAVGDICNTADTLPQKKEGRLFYHNFIEAIGFSETGAQARFENSRQVFNTFAEAYNLPIAANSLVPHAPYTVSPALFDLVANFPGNQLLTIHNQESEAENEFYRTGQGDLSRLYTSLGIDRSFFSGTGKRSLESYLPHFYRNQTLILVHNVATGEEDLRFALGREPGINKARPGTYTERSTGSPDLFFCLCPNANLYISGQLPDPELLIRQGCRIVVGTDSLASNHQLSILEELKTLQRQFPRLSTASLLQWATANGAQALQIDGLLGSFTEGKQPGVLLIGGMKEGLFNADTGVRRLL